MREKTTWKFEFPLAPIIALGLVLIIFASAVWSPNSAERREEILKACLSGGHPIQDCKELAEQ